MAEKRTSEMNKEQLLECIIDLLPLCSEEYLRNIHTFLLSLLFGIGRKMKGGERDE